MAGEAPKPKPVRFEYSCRNCGHWDFQHRDGTGRCKARRLVKQSGWNRSAEYVDCDCPCMVRSKA